MGRGRTVLQGAAEAEYVIVRVLDVKSAPVIADVVVDPVRLWREGKLALENRDFVVRTALPEPGANEE